MTRLGPITAPARARPPLLEIRDLAVSFGGGRRERIQAVDGLDLTIYPAQTVAVVGESGCGKSVTALSTLRLVPCPPAHYDRGAIRLEGRDLLRMPKDEMLRVRGGEIAMIFQEPLSSLNPVLTVGDQVIEAIRRHQRVNAREARAIAIEAFHEVGIPSPEERLRAYPHQFSGGMCQRVMTATALACRPKLLLADEPTTALDVTIQDQILRLLVDLQRRRGMAIMLITHDLGVVAQVADVVCVVYAGRVVEYARVYDLFDRPMHPYTQGLFASIPRIEDRRRRLLTVREAVSDPAAFRRLPGHQYGVVPWWPGMSPPDGIVPGAGPYQLHEVVPDHWVACWRTEYVADHPARPPDLDFRREAVAAGQSD